MAKLALEQRLIDRTTGYVPRLGTGTPLGLRKTALNMPIGNIIGGAAEIAKTGLGLGLNQLLQKQNYKWGKKAADDAFARQMEMYERMYQDRSPANIVKQLGEAGLSKSLMFASGAGGVGGQSQGATGPQAGQYQTQVMDLANLKLLQAQINNMEANTQKTKADTIKTAEETTTITGLRPEQIGALHQSGLAQYLANKRTEWENQGKWRRGWQDEEGNWHLDVTKDKLYGQGLIDEDSIFDKTATGMAENVVKQGMNTDAQRIFTETKTQGYFQELLNATKQADAAATQAAAQKMAAEFNYGDEANWKYWVQVGKDAVGAITDIAGEVTNARKIKEVIKKIKK